MGSSCLRSDSPHAVMVPYPAQGHITPMLKVAQLLHSKGFHVTFVNTEFNHRRLVRSRGPGSVRGLGGFRFEAISDGLPAPSADAGADGTQDIQSLCDSTRRNSLAPFRRLLARLGDDASVPKVTCIVSDGAMSFTLDAAKEIGVPDVLFWTPSACGVMAYLHYEHLICKTSSPFLIASTKSQEMSLRKFSRWRDIFLKASARMMVKRGHTRSSMRPVDA